DDAELADADAEGAVRAGMALRRREPRGLDDQAAEMLAHAGTRRDCHRERHASRGAGRKRQLAPRERDPAADTVLACGRVEVDGAARAARGGVDAGETDGAGGVAAVRDEQRRVEASAGAAVDDEVALRPLADGGDAELRAVVHGRRDGRGGARREPAGE